MSTKHLVVYSVAFSVLSGVSPLYAATVTVDPAGIETPGVLYTTLMGAVNNITTGDSWANGENDTILVEATGVHIVDQMLTLSTYGDASTLTIKKVGDTSPIIALHDFSFPSRLFYMHTTGTFILEGLTCIGAIGVPGREANIRAAFWIEADNPGVEVTAQIRDCVVTANNGSNQPVLNYLLEPPVNGEGCFQRAVYSGDDPYRGKINVLTENCAFAYFTQEDGGIEICRVVAPDNPFTPPTRIFTFRHCLFANSNKAPNPGNNGHLFMIRSCGTETTINIEDCLFIKGYSRVLFMRMGDDPGPEYYSPTINIKHCIFDNRDGQEPVTQRQTFMGSFNVDGLTVYRPGADIFIFEDQAGGTGNYSIKNVVALNIDSVLRFEPAPDPGSGPAPASIVASNLAVNNAARATQDPDFKATMDAAIVTTEDPAYVTMDIGTLLTGARNWDSTTNSFFDVGNPNYGTLCSGGAPLVGGAEYAVTKVSEWNQY